MSCVVVYIPYGIWSKHSFFPEGRPFFFQILESRIVCIMIKAVAASVMPHLILKTHSVTSLNISNTYQNYDRENAKKKNAIFFALNVRERYLLMQTQSFVWRLPCRLNYYIMFLRANEWIKKNEHRTHTFMKKKSPEKWIKWIAYKSIKLYDENYKGASRERCDAIQ